MRRGKRGGHRCPDSATPVPVFCEAEMARAGHLVPTGHGRLHRMDSMPAFCDGLIRSRCGRRC
eukprot:10185186-Lingulodinium_polyedra.AAC.1